MIHRPPENHHRYSVFSESSKAVKTAFHVTSTYLDFSAASSPCLILSMFELGLYSYSFWIITVFKICLGSLAVCCSSGFLRLICNRLLRTRLVPLLRARKDSRGLEAGILKSLRMRVFGRKFDLIEFAAQSSTMARYSVEHCCAIVFVQPNQVQWLPIHSLEDQVDLHCRQGLNPDFGRHQDLMKENYPWQNSSLQCSAPQKTIPGLLPQHQTHHYKRNYWPSSIAILKAPPRSGPQLEPPITRCYGFSDWLSAYKPTSGPLVDLIQRSCIHPVLLLTSSRLPFGLFLSYYLFNKFMCILVRNYKEIFNMNIYYILVNKFI